MTTEGSLLTEISVENFCRFGKPCTIQIHTESTSLLGEHGRGKTTVLTAIELFTRLFEQSIIDDTSEYSIELQKTDFAKLIGFEDYELIWYKKDTSKVLKISGKIFRQTDPICFEVSAEVGTDDDESSGTVTVTCNCSRSKLKEIGCPTVLSISNIGAFTVPFSYDRQGSEESASYEDIESQNVYNIGVDSRRHVRKLLRLYTENILESLKKKGDQITEVLDNKEFEIRPGCKVEFIPTVAEKKVQIEVIEHDVSLPLFRCDAGLQQVIIIILMVLYVQEEKERKPMHLLLDEPVSLFHGSLVRKLLKYLKKEQFRVVLACHAVDTLMACSRRISLDDVDPHIIPKDLKKELGTLFRETDYATTLMKFSKALRTKRILIVENETDADVLKAWIKRTKDIDIDDKIVVHGHGGRPTHNDVIKLVGSLDKNLFLPNKVCEKEEEKARVFIFTDRDYKAKDALKREKDLLKENTKKFVRIKVQWYSYKNRNELENYLLSVPALESYLKEKGKDTANVNTEELSRLVEEHCHAFSIREQYVSSLKYVKDMKGGKAKLKDPGFNKETEDEPKKWLEQPSFSFTDAKEVLKELGVELESQSYTGIIHHFPSGDIDEEIETLADEVLSHFSIEVPTVPPGAAAPPSEGTVSTSRSQRDDLDVSELGPDLD